jgi:hypothetical protein
MCLVTGIEPMIGIGGLRWGRRLEESLTSRQLIRVADRGTGVQMQIDWLEGGYLNGEMDVTTLMDCRALLVPANMEQNHRPWMFPQISVR